MEWTDDGFIIGTRKHGETSLILEVMTRTHGRHLGLVKGGRSRRMQPLLQPGNSVDVTWRARLDEHLGFYAVEATTLRAGALMAAAAPLHGFNLVAALLRLLAEREPHEGLFDRAAALLEQLGDVTHAPRVLVNDAPRALVNDAPRALVNDAPRALVNDAPRALVAFELAILADCGFGVDLDTCAATGSTRDLTFVSPKTARAVSRAAGEPYQDRLLRLPGFLVNDRVNHVPLTEVCDGFALTGFFLSRNLFAPRGLALPDARDAYIALLAKAAALEA